MSGHLGTYGATWKLLLTLSHSEGDKTQESSFSEKLTRLVYKMLLMQATPIALPAVIPSFAGSSAIVRPRLYMKIHFSSRGYHADQT